MGASKRNKIKRKGRYFVYIVQCKNGTFYTGYTNSLEKRIKEHNSGRRGAKYLRGKTPAKLVWCKEYQYYKRAVITEKRIKELTRRQKETLVNGKRLDKVLMDAEK